MQKKSILGVFKGILTIAALAAIVSVPAYAVSTSQNYQIVEQEFGAGSSLESCSGSYCARTTIGDLAGGSSTSQKSTAKFGSVMPDDPLLEVIIDPGVSYLGELTTEKTAYKTMTVRIRSHLSNGYFLQITGDPPKYGNHTLAALSSPTASTPGKEQFGINAVANSIPEVGKNIAFVPSSDFSLGELELNYATPNLFMYKSGDTVARSEAESGRTDYTISMIINIANTTPAGHYNGDFSAVVVPMF